MFSARVETGKHLPCLLSASIFLFLTELSQCRTQTSFQVLNSVKERNRNWLLHYSTTIKNSARKLH